MHLGEGAQLLRNDLHTGNWIKVRLRSKTARGEPVGFGDGTKVIAHVGSAAMRRTVSSVSYLSQNSRVLHFGIGSASHVDQLEVRWHAGATNYYRNLEANRLWEIIEAEPSAKPIISVAGTSASASKPFTSLRLTASPSPNGLYKARTVEFWTKQRAAMNALKVEKNIPRAIELFRAALALDPQHEDSHYYLSQCLANQGDAQGALEELQELIRINPNSHRGFQQYGALRAISAQSDSDLAAAEESLEKALTLNREETGSLLLLAEVALLRGNPTKAEEGLSAVCRTNPRSVAGLFLRSYIAWKGGNIERSTELLAEARQALGKDWQPKGTTAEGDVKQKQFLATTPLSRFWEEWNGAPTPSASFANLEMFLSTR
jgi:tetratricopeptide (TPR) repeat protein